MVAYVSVLVALVGAIVYFVSANAKAAELARIAFFCGLLVFLFSIAGQSIKIS